MDRRSFVTGLAGGTLCTVGGCSEPADEITRDGPEQSSSSTIHPESVDGRWRMAEHDARASGYNPALTPSEPGDPAWLVTLPPEQVPEQSVIGADSVYLGIRDNQSTPADTRVVSLGFDNGEVEWSISMPYSGIAAPAIGPGPDRDLTVFVMSGQDHSNTGPGRGIVRALDPDSGSVRWEWSIEAKLGNSIVSVDGVIVVTSVALNNVAVHALDAAEGSELWSFPADGWLHNTPTVHEGRVYLSSDRRELAALDLDDGSVLWRTTTQADDTRPVLDRYRDLVYVGHERGLEAFELENEGRRAWEFISTESGTSNEEYLGVIDEPVVMPDQLVIRTTDTSYHDLGDVGHCYGIDPNTGSQLWQLPNGRPASSIIGAGNYLLIRRGDSASAINSSYDQSMVDSESADMVAVQSDGSVAWTRRGLWKPIALGNGCLMAYRNEADTESFDVACFSDI